MVPESSELAQVFHQLNYLHNWGGTGGGGQRLSTLIRLEFFLFRFFFAFSRFGC
jgi:hypothetical protein